MGILYTEIYLIAVHLHRIVAGEGLVIRIAVAVRYASVDTTPEIREVGTYRQALERFPTCTNAEHTAYTADSPENVKALELLQSMDGVYFNAAENGGEEITAFRQGILKMAFCWNIAQQLNTDNNDAELTNDGEKIVFMSFPSETGESKLQGGIWGFGVFDNGDAAKIEAAKTFIKYFADGEGTILTADSVTRTAAQTAPVVEETETDGAA